MRVCLGDEFLHSRPLVRVRLPPEMPRSSRNARDRGRWSKRQARAFSSRQLCFAPTSSEIDSNRNLSPASATYTPSTLVTVTSRRPQHFTGKASSADSASRRYTATSAEREGALEVQIGPRHPLTAAAVSLPRAFPHKSTICKRLATPAVLAHSSRAITPKHGIQPVLEI